MINRLISCLVAFWFVISSMAQQKVSYKRDYLYMVDKINGAYIPKDIDEAISALDTLLNIDKHFIKDSVSLTDFCRDLSLGSFIRARWGLWGGSRLQKYFNDKQVYNPDYMSQLILKAYYELTIKGMSYPPEGLIKPDFDSDPMTNKYYTKQVESEIKEKADMLKKEGFVKGDTIYFQYPYGCSTMKEQQIWLEEPDIHSFLPKGIITDIAIDGYFLESKIKVKLISSFSPYGIIVFDGDMEPDLIGEFERDFDNFTIHNPNRFYMQKGDELWFDVKSNFWISKFELNSL